MRAMVLDRPGEPLALRDLETPEPGPGQVRLRVEACGVCRTDLHVVDGELPDPKLPLILGHEVVGRVEALGEGVEGIETGARMGAPWLGHVCGDCEHCRAGRENLCDAPGFHGWTLDGGYAEAMLVEAPFLVPLPEDAEPAPLTPLLCAGLIGWRSYRKAGDAQRLGLYGFGAAAHLLAQAAIREGREVHAFVRPGDEAAADFARRLGCASARGSDQQPDDPLDAAILFAPVGDLVPAALRAVRKGGRVVCGGIHMSDIPSFPYSILWGERRVESVANLTREDARSFFEQVDVAALEVETTEFPLEEANDALSRLRDGRLTGAAVLIP
ncbi:MAG: zinc-dependent alcohol dehydrogenase family protein [Paracoccaceae bacterium]